MDQWISDVLGWFASETGESVRNWGATIGGLVALSIAALTYRRNVRLKREEQARLVYARIEAIETFEPGGGFNHRPGVALYEGTDTNLVSADDTHGNSSLVVVDPVVRVRIQVHNRSEELISRVTLGLESLALNGPATLYFDVCDPKAGVMGDFVVHNPFGDKPAFQTTVDFVDATGRRWHRFEAEPIKRKRSQTPLLARRDRQRRQLRSGIDTYNLLNEATRKQVDEPGVGHASGR